MKDTRGEDLPGVNRHVIVVVATTAYADWAGSCPGDASEDVLSALADEDGTAYLIPELEGDCEAWLQRNYHTIFEHELWAWHTDESFWPNDLSFEAFQTFFDVRFYSMVLDMGEDPIERDCLP